MQSQARLNYAEVHPVFRVAKFTVTLRFTDFFNLYFLL